MSRKKKYYLDKWGVWMFEDDEDDGEEGCGDACEEEGCDETEEDSADDYEEGCGD